MFFFHPRHIILTLCTIGQGPHPDSRKTVMAKENGKSPFVGGDKCIACKK